MAFRRDERDEGQQVWQFVFLDRLIRVADVPAHRALQSHAQKLGEQVTSMSAKIKELECALAAAHLQLRSGSEPPEESGDRTQEWHHTNRRRSYGESTGSLAIDQDGVSRYYGDTASSEVRRALR